MDPVRQELLPSQKGREAFDEFRRRLLCVKNEFLGNLPDIDLMPIY